MEKKATGSLLTRNLGDLVKKVNTIFEIPVAKNNFLIVLKTNVLIFLIIIIRNILSLIQNT